MVSNILKALTNAGVGSRRRMADAIRQGRVAVNGKIIEGLRYPLDVDTASVSIDGKLVAIKPGQRVYLIINKPRGVLSTARDDRGRTAILDILPEKYHDVRLYPVGRLDRESTGLLLLTNDGELTYQLTHPRFEHEKEYLIHIDGCLRPDEMRELERGVDLEDGITSPAVIREAKSVPPYNYSIIIHEGKKRQVRRMLDRLGHRVLALKRIRMGGLSLGNLREGDMRELTPREVRSLLSAVPDRPVQGRGLRKRRQIHGREDRPKQ